MLYLSVRTVETHRAHIMQKLRLSRLAPSSCGTRSTRACSKSRGLASLRPAQRCGFSAARNEGGADGFDGEARFEQVDHSAHANELRRDLADRADGPARSGRLELRSRAPRLRGLERRRRRHRRRFRTADVTDVRIVGRPRDRLSGRQTLVLERRQRRTDPHRRHRAPRDRLRARRASRVAPRRRGAARTSRAVVVLPLRRGRHRARGRAAARRARRSIPTRSASSGTTSSSRRARRSSCSRPTPPRRPTGCCRARASGRPPRRGRTSSPARRGSPTTSTRGRGRSVPTYVSFEPTSGPGRQRRRRPLLSV